MQPNKTPHETLRLQSLYLRSLMTLHKYTVRELASEMLIHKSRVQKLISGMAPMNIIECFELAAATGETIFMYQGFQAALDDTRRRIIEKQNAWRKKIINPSVHDPAYLKTLSNYVNPDFNDTLQIDPTCTHEFNPFRDNKE